MWSQISYEITPRQIWQLWYYTDLIHDSPLWEEQRVLRISNVNPIFGNSLWDAMLNRPALQSGLTMRRIGFQMQGVRYWCIFYYQCWCNTYNKYTHTKRGLSLICSLVSLCATYISLIPVTSNSICHQALPLCISRFVNDIYISVKWSLNVRCV